MCAWRACCAEGNQSAMHLRRPHRAAAGGERQTQAAGAPPRGTCEETGLEYCEAAFAGARGRWLAEVIGATFAKAQWRGKRSLAG
jgi:hypothetical protein